MLYLVKQKQSLFDNVIDGFGEDEQPLPSNRNEIIEKLKKIIDISADEKPKKKVDITTITQDLVARFDKRVSFVAENEKNNSKIIVIDKKESSIVEKIEKIADEKSQILSSEEFELIKKLDALGFVKINDKLKIALGGKKPKSNNKKILKTYLKKIEKNNKLIKILKQSGFDKKSLASICKNSIIILQTLALVHGIKKKKLSVKTLKLVKDKYAVRDDFEEFFEKLDDGKVKKRDRKLINKNYKTLLSIVEKLQ